MRLLGAVLSFRLDGPPGPRLASHLFTMYVHMFIFRIPALMLMLSACCAQ